jgi:hypothetical protein
MRQRAFRSGAASAAQTRFLRADGLQQRESQPQTGGFSPTAPREADKTSEANKIGAGGRRCGFDSLSSRHYSSSS